MSAVSVDFSMRKKSEWPRTVTHDDLISLGWKPLPINEFIIKVHSRCNLACDYCYVYAMTDSGWQRQPGAMSDKVVRQAAARIAEHASAHGLDQVAIVLHGGEPLLLGSKRLAQVLEVLRAVIDEVAAPLFSVQTNGLLLSHDVLEVLNEFDVEIGISLDGGELENDRHRTNRAGAGSFNEVARRTNELRDGPFGRLFAGFLATIDVTNDPLRVYEALRAFAPPGLDFLLPHGNWTQMPPHMSTSETPYANWLIAIFDQWFDSSHHEPSIRLFDAIIRLIYGFQTPFESIGLHPTSLAVIETDGSYELVDALKSAYDGAAFTGLDVFENSINDMLSMSSVAVRQLTDGQLSDTCRRCDVKRICGGGYFPHRYKAGSGFYNPSVYCRDLKHLISHIKGRLGA